MPGMQSRRPFSILLLVIEDCIIVCALSLKSNERVVRTSLALLAMGLYGYFLVFRRWTILGLTIAWEAFLWDTS